MSAEPPPSSVSLDLPSLCFAITEHAPLPIAMVEGATHLVRYANQAFCRLMGGSAEEMVGKPFSDLLPEKDICITLLDRVYRLRRSECHVEQDDSKPHPVFWAYTMWPAIHGDGLVGVMLQVTETAEAHGETIAMNEALLLGSIRQHELAEAGEHLNAVLREEVAARERIACELSEKARQLSEKARLLDLTYDAIIVRGMEGEIRYWNHGAEELYGWSREEALGKISHVLLQTEFPTPVEQVTEALCSTGRWIGELIHTKRDGQRINVLVRKTLDRVGEGNTAVVLENVTDITARRALEDSLAQRAEELARADRSKDEFLAMLAHELRNPLAPLRNAAEILQSPGATAVECAEARAILSRQISNMTRMIDDLLDVSRITEGKIDLRREPVSLENIFTASASLARSACAAHGQKLRVSLPIEPIYLNADSTRLEQVFSNLLGNASKYSGDGCNIWFSAARADDGAAPKVVVTVRDDGTGIAPELLPRVFDLFVQASRSPDRAHGGLGIGLTLVERLVKLHGGSVEAHSDGLGKGCEFIVTLPILCAAEPASPPAYAPPGAAREVSRRILIVDDNIDAARSLDVLQRRRGHDTRIAFTGPDAVAAAAEFLPQVVLLDIGLPAMDGFEVARRLRAMPALKAVFIVAMSGYGSDEDRRIAKDAGFDEYLVKPMDLDLLREWIAEPNFSSRRLLE